MSRLEKLRATATISARTPKVRFCTAEAQKLEVTNSMFEDMLGNKPANVLQQELGNGQFIYR